MAIGWCSITANGRRDDERPVSVPMATHFEAAHLGNA